MCDSVSVTVFQLANLFGNAYLKLATAQTAANGFRKTRFYPLNCNIFKDHEFAPSNVTEQVQPGADASDQIFDDIFTPVNATQEVPDEVQRLADIQKPLNEDEQRLADDFQEPLGLNDAQRPTNAPASAANPEQVTKDPELVTARTYGFISPFH